MLNRHSKLHAGIELVVKNQRLLLLRKLLESIGYRAPEVAAQNDSRISRYRPIA